MHRFDESHSLAAQYGNDWWIPIYRRAFPTLMSAVAIENDGWAQRAGIDRLLTLACGRTFNDADRLDHGDGPRRGDRIVRGQRPLLLLGSMTCKR